MTFLIRRRPSEAKYSQQSHTLTTDHKHNQIKIAQTKLQTVRAKFNKNSRRACTFYDTKYTCTICYSTWPGVLYLNV